MPAAARLAAQTGLYLVLGTLFGVASTQWVDGEPGYATSLGWVDMQFLLPTVAAGVGAFLRPPEAPGWPVRAALACGAVFSTVIVLAWLVATGLGLPMDEALSAATFGAVRTAVAGVFGTLIGARLSQGSTS